MFTFGCRLLPFVALLALRGLHEKLTSEALVLSSKGPAADKGSAMSKFRVSMHQLRLGMLKSSQPGCHWLVGLSLVAISRITCSVSDSLEQEDESASATSRVSSGAFGTSDGAANRSVSACPMLGNDVSSPPIGSWLSSKGEVGVGTTSLVAAWPTCGGIGVKSPDLVTSGENLPCLMSFSSSTRNGALCKSRAYTSRAPFVDLVVTKDEAVIWCSTISAEHHKRCGLASMWCEPIRYEVRALLKNSTKPFANLC